LILEEEEDSQLKAKRFSKRGRPQKEKKKRKYAKKAF